jgi:hypothetical protein
MIILLGFALCVCAASFAGTPFSYVQDYSDKDAWREDVFQLEDTGGGKEGQWSGDGGRVGAAPPNTSLTLIYLFRFPAGIETLDIEHELTAWNHGAGDEAKMFTSFDGKKWTQQYEMLESWKHLKFKKSYGGEFISKHLFFLKFYFFQGAPDRKPDDCRGACIGYLAVTGTMQKDIPNFNNKIIAHDILAVTITQSKLTTTWGIIKDKF